MMMKMLADGGLPSLTDKIRNADEDNPNGYYEFEPVKQLADGGHAWLAAADGKADQPEAGDAARRCSQTDIGDTGRQPWGWHWGSGAPTP